MNMHFRAKIHRNNKIQQFKLHTKNIKKLNNIFYIFF